MRQQRPGRGPGQHRSTPPALEPVQPSRAKGNWLMGGDHQVNPHSLPGRVGSLGTADSSPSGLQQAENADTLLKGIHGVVLPVEAAGVSRWYRTRPRGRAGKAEHCHRGWGSRARLLAVSREGTGCPRLLLQVVHHGYQQPHLAALLRVSDEEVHIMALQLPPEGGQYDSWVQHGDTPHSPSVGKAPRSCSGGAGPSAEPAHRPPYL